MTKTIWILAIVAAFIVGTSMAFIIPGNVAEAQRDPLFITTLVDAIKLPGETSCTPGTVKHWDKIIFEVNQQFIADEPGANPPTLFPAQAYDIKVPDTVGVIADLHGIVVGDLISKGYHVPGTTNLPRSDDINIRDVEYAIFCLKT